jgi:hypothetical protein
MARIRSVSHHTRGDFLLACVIVHTCIARKMDQEGEASSSIYLLATGPHSLVKSWQTYDINGFTFDTKAKDSRSQCQNSGVRLNAEDSTGQKMLIMGILKKFGKSIKKCLYKFIYSNVNG